MASPTSLQRLASTVVPSDASECGLDIQVIKDNSGTGFEILFDVKPFSGSTRDDSRMMFLVEQVRIIGEQAFWGNNCIADCNTRMGWRLNIACQTASSGDEVLGFVVYKIEPKNKVLQIQYIAVAEKHRGRGVGSKLIKSLQKYASTTLTNSMVERLACACVPEAVEFYQKHCFRKMRRIVAEQSDSVDVFPRATIEIQIPLQFHMEWRVPHKKVRIKR